MPSLSTIATLMLPPASLTPVALLAVALFRGRAGRILAGLALMGMLLLSLPVVAAALFASLEVMPPPAETPPTETPPGAIVVLGGDVERIPDPPGVSIGGLSLERVRAGAALQRRSGLPVLVSGGIVSRLPVPVGALMAESMAEDFNVPVRWTEATSLTTWENAQNSAPLLAASGITRVHLVTHAWHMRRSLLAFGRFGIDATPAPVRRDPAPVWSRREFMPSAAAWHRSFYAIHEWVGLAYYSTR